MLRAKFEIIQIKKSGEIKHPNLAPVVYPVPSVS
jgi:hypothetical protein